MAGFSLEETWATRELPILRLALREVDAGRLADLEEIRSELGLPGMQVYASVNALSDAGYIEMYLSGGWTDDFASGMILKVYERARRELGTWPSAENAVSQLAAALREAADNEPEPERKTRLRATADALTGIAQDVAVRWAETKLGLPG